MEGIIGLEASVAALARSALGAGRAAALTAEHHRELFVAAPVGDRGSRDTSTCSCAPMTDM